VDGPIDPILPACRHKPVQNKHHQFIWVLIHTQIICVQIPWNPYERSKICKHHFTVLKLLSTLLVLRLAACLLLIIHQLLCKCKHQRTQFDELDPEVKKLKASYIAILSVLYHYSVTKETKVALRLASPRSSPYRGICSNK